MSFSPAYAAAKGGVAMFSHSMDEALNPKVIAVRAFYPQFVNTAFVRGSSEELERM